MLPIGNHDFNFQYVLDGNIIDTVQHMNDIGVIIQSNLKFTIQCTATVKKAYYVIHNIFTTFKNHEQSFYWKMYTCYVRPILEYNSQVWSPLLKYSIDRIEKVQRYFTRRIFQVYVPYSSRLNELKTESLEERRIKADLILFFKIYYCMTDINVTDYYRFTNRSRTNSKQLYVFYSRTDKRKLFWLNRLVKYWNDLPENIVNILDFRNFKAAITNTVRFNGRGSIYC